MDQNMEPQQEQQIVQRENRIITESQRLRKEVRNQTIGYIVGAFGIVAGLAWNEAIRALIDHFAKSDANSLPAKFLYAIIITLIVVVVTMYLLRYKGEDEK